MQNRSPYSSQSSVTISIGVKFNMRSLKRLTHFFAHHLQYYPLNHRKYVTH